MSITENIVMSLMVSFLHLGYKLWMENWSNSPGLAKRLLAARTRVCGTLRSNRKEVPKLVQKHLNNTKLKKGESVTYSSDKIMVGTWQDKKPINALHYAPELQSSTNRQHNSRWSAYPKTNLHSRL